MILALVGAALIGACLGLLGSGGSILTVPVLRYLLQHPEKAAIAESLGIVGAIAAVGAIPYARGGLVDWRSVVLFGIPGMIGAYGGAWLSVFASGALQLVIFASVMLVAAYMMARPPRRLRLHEAVNPEPRTPWRLALDGLVVGALTGFVGVGGGFLIVPALVLLARLPMKKAVGTSLVIIAMKSASGFYKYLDVLPDADVTIDWGVIGAFSAIGVVGAFAGHSVAARVNQRALRRAFAVFLVVMGLIILVKESYGLLAPVAGSP